MIPDSVVSWYSKYSYIKNFPGTAEKYEEQIPKFIDACRIYENEMNYYESIKANKRSKSNDGLSVLRQSFINRQKS